MTEISKLTISSAEDFYLSSETLHNYIELNKFYFLNKTSCEYDQLEQYIYAISKFQCERLNKKFDDTYVEFCLRKPLTHTPNIIYDKNYTDFVFPFLTCILSLSNEKMRLINTNVDFDAYKYKNFSSQTNFKVFYLMHNEYVAFDGKHCYSNICNESSECYVEIRLWEKIYKKPYLYSSSCEKFDICSFSHTDITNTKDIEINSCDWDKDIFEKMLYYFDTSILSKFNSYFLKNSDINSFSFKVIIPDTVFKKKINDDIVEINKEDNKIIHNRFLQRFIYKNTYTPDICKWIIIEAEQYASKNGGWNTSRHNHYPTTDLVITNIPNVLNFVLISLQNILKNVVNSYSLNSDIPITVREMFIVKYNSNMQSELDLHADGCFLTMNMQLNDTTEFEGGGTYFEDGITTRLEQGDLIVHSSKTKHSGIKITSGTRYILVFFMDL